MSWQPEVELLSVTEDAEHLIEMRYRNCWQSEPKRKGIEARRRFVTSCIKKGHLSPVEFADAAFRAVASRACTHQMVRHRLASYAQESQRYVEENDASYIVIPDAVLENNRAALVFSNAIGDVWAAYSCLLDLGIRKEDARFLLPNACKSVIDFKMNFRAWRHFFRVRCHPAAQWEIRGIATRVLKLLYPSAPSVFGDFYAMYVEKDPEAELWTEND